MDDSTKSMRDHLAGCYQARGFTPAGSEQLANQERLSDPVDQAMYKAHDRSHDGDPGGGRVRADDKDLESFSEEQRLEDERKLRIYEIEAEAERAEKRDLDLAIGRQE